MCHTNGFFNGSPTNQQKCIHSKNMEEEEKKYWQHKQIDRL